MTTGGAADKVDSAETDAWRAFVTAWWARFQDGEVSVDDLFLIALAIPGLGLGKRWKRSRRVKFDRLLNSYTASMTAPYRVTPNRTVRGVQMWRLLYIQPEVTAFVPSSEWQQVPDGYVCPPGGEFNMNLQSGVTLGRWPGLAEATR
jgi:hypothetical protein